MSRPTGSKQFCLGRTAACIPMHLMCSPCCIICRWLIKWLLFESNLYICLLIMTRGRRMVFHLSVSFPNLVWILIFKHFWSWDLYLPHYYSISNLSQSGIAWFSMLIEQPSEVGEAKGKGGNRPRSPSKFLTWARIQTCLSPVPSQHTNSCIPLAAIQNWNLCEIPFCLS